MARSRTYIATPPGATIKEQLIDRGMSQKEFASRMDMSEKHISKLINGEVGLTPDVAMRLEMVLGVPARFWNNLESIYREKLQAVQAENAMDEDEKVINLRKYFEVVRLSMLHVPLIPGIACRRQAVSEKADFALLAWAQKAKLEARDIKTKPIDLQGLTANIPTIRKMTLMPPEEFCPLLCRMLTDCGIALVFLPHIGGSFLHGATFYDKDKVVIGLTVRGRDADKFWFSLFHEIAHVLLGHINNPDGTTDIEEAAADSFARSTLIPDEEFKNFAASNRIDASSMKDFAASVEIDVGIVVGRLQKEGYLNYNRFNSLKTKYGILTRPWR